MRTSPFDVSVPIGIPKLEWLPIAMELEMFYEKKDKGSEMAMQETVEKGFNSVKHNNDGCSERMFKVFEGHVDMKNGWVFEKESPGDGSSMWEISSPTDLSEEEAEVACQETHALAPDWGKGEPDLESNNPPGFHVHVAAKCLLSDARRLVLLILVWDKYYSAMLDLTGGVHHMDKTQRKYAETYKDKNIGLYDALKSVVTNDEKLGENDLVAIFTKFEAAGKGSRSEKSGQNQHPEDEKHDGYRRYVLNVCHLLEVNCAHLWPEKNNVPKFGAVEFRGFDTVVGEALRFVITVMQRLVQVFCARDVDDLTKFLGQDFDEGSANFPDLLQLLGLRMQ